MSTMRRWISSVASDQSLLERCGRIDLGDRRSNGAWSIAVSKAAAKSSSLSAKTLKIVPSDTPAAAANSRLVAVAPRSISNGRTASMMSARRAAGGSGAARRRIAWAGRVGTASG